MSKSLIELRSTLREARVASSPAFRIGQTASRWRPSPSSASYYGADYQIDERSLQVSWAVASELALTHPLVEPALNAVVSISRIGEIEPEPATDDPELNRMLDEVWNDYARDPVQCDIHAKHDFYQLTESAFRLNRWHGDSFAVISPNSQVTVLEAWRCRSPSRGRDPKYGAFGIRRDSDGHEAISYWFTKTQRDPLDQIKVDEVDEYECRNENGELIVLHPQAPGRPASRSISRLTPVAELLGMAGDSVFSEVCRQQITACQSFVVEMELPDYQELKTLGLLSDAELKKYFDLDARTWKMAPNAFYNAIPGAKVRQMNGSVNPANFLALWKLIAVCLAVNLDCPLLAVELEAGAANFSQCRIAMDQTDARMNVLRNWWITGWHIPIYRHVMRRVLKRNDPVGDAARAYVRKKGGGQITKNGINALLKVDWAYPERPYTEPVKEATGHAIEIAEGLTTLTAWTRKRHAQSWQRFAHQHRLDRVIALTEAFEGLADLRKKFSTDPEALKAINALHWSEIVPISRPKAMYSTMPLAAEQVEMQKDAQDNQQELQREALDLQKKQQEQQQRQQPAKQGGSK